MGTAEALETSGLTARLVLLYAQRAGGRPAVEAILAACGASDREAELLDEHHWISYALKIRLFEAATEVLGPDVMFDVGATAIAAGAGGNLKIALKALGSPAMVYRNITRANDKFSRGHEMQLLDSGPRHVRLRFVDRRGQRYHPLDCQYTRGLLAGIPLLFGQPMARVQQVTCGVEGGDGCVYDVHWAEAGNHTRFALVTGALSALAISLAVSVNVALVPLAVAGALAATAVVLVRDRERLTRRVDELDAELRDRAMAADRLRRSLQDLVSELRLEDLLSKVTEHATAAVGGSDFALLAAGDDGLRCQSSSGLPEESLRALERWANASPGLTTTTRLVDDVASVGALAPLGNHPTAPLRSLCSAPLIVRGTPLGVLVALSTNANTLLPHDVEQLRSYATQAAIAIFNARLYRSQRHLATHDGLTDLLNHRAFHETLATALDGNPVVILADLDGFKAVNDRDGHAAGDQLLREVAAALRAATRAGESVFRVGGDEFAILLPDGDQAAGQAVAERARAAVDAIDERVTASVGIATCPSDGTDAATLLSAADARLYAMKTAHHRARVLA